VVPWTISTGIGATSGAAATALKAKYVGSESTVIVADHVGASVLRVRS
jgi:hypothetical protein